MEATIREEKETKETTVKDKKIGERKWLNRFSNFLIYGGWLLIVVFIAVIITIISVLSK